MLYICYVICAVYSRVLVLAASGYDSGYHIAVHGARFAFAFACSTSALQHPALSTQISHSGPHATSHMHNAMHWHWHWLLHRRSPDWRPCCALRYAL
jgi:hypothetical protein